MKHLDKIIRLGPYRPVRKLADEEFIIRTIKECLEERDFHAIKEIASAHLKAKRKMKDMESNERMQ
jgi:hypothetical protein